MRPYLKKILHKKGLAQGIGPQFKPQYREKKLGKTKANQRN
jgi:hypothetical protein